MLFTYLIILMFLFLLTVAVAVSVAVGGAERTEMGGIGAIEYEGHVAVTAGVVEVLYLGEHIALEQAGTDHEEGHVGM